MNHTVFMRAALAEADRAAAHGEVPVGAVVVHHDRIIARGYNQCRTLHDATAHAEIVALRQAGLVLNNYRLTECDVYVTLEPCPMCAGAMVNARIRHVFFGAYDYRWGAAGSVHHILDDPRTHANTRIAAPSTQGTYRPRITSGILQTECEQRLKTFFHARRAKRLQTPPSPSSSNA